MTCFQLNMKLVSFIVSLSAMAQLFSGSRANDLRCLKSLSPSSEGYMEVSMLAVPKSKAGKCLYECMLRSVRVVKHGGLINIDKFMHKLRNLKFQDTLSLSRQSHDMVEELLEICKDHKDMSGDNCETTANLLNCTVEESKRRGWEPTQIIRILRAPYYADAIRMKNVYLSLVG